MHSIYFTAGKDLGKLCFAKMDYEFRPMLSGSDMGNLKALHVFIFSLLEFDKHSVLIIQIFSVIYASDMDS